MNPPSRVWAFAGCVLDERRLELKVGGEVTALDRKPLEVLLHLLRHAGEVVTKDELAEAAWPGRIITDSNLTKTMAVLRAALGDAGQAAIKTVHGYGYRLVAPVSVQTPADDGGAARFDFKAGESPPLRPLWQLATRLGTGGQGEVWLAHHRGTKAARVFKFAEGGRALTALKREITLNRLLREMLPGRDDFLRLLDWNVDEPPFFAESEYVAGGNLAVWAEAQGGLAAIPLERRLALLAAIAEAVAAAHAVGVLHKDLKPGNVLVDDAAGVPRVKLADFGSGGVVDPAAIEAHGITRMGFTQTLHAGPGTSGTPAYLAPEVLAGQPFTMRSDIYALGVMLYQLVAGDLRKALAPGWEKDVPDELLREDIAAAAAGDPADRPADAGRVAAYLRALAGRRQQREQARAARLEAQRAAAVRAQLRRLRVTLGVGAAALVCVTVAGAYAWRTRNEAHAALVTAQAVSDYVTRDLLGSIDPHQRSVAELSVKDMLATAAQQVDERFAGQPAAAAELHLALARSYYHLDMAAEYRREAQRAATLFEEIAGRDHPRTLEALSELALGLMSTDDLAAARRLYAEVLERRTRRLGEHHPAVFETQMQLVAVDHGLGAWIEARDRMCQIAAAMATRFDETQAVRRLGEFSCARVEAYLGNYAAAEALALRLAASLEAVPARQNLLNPRTLRLAAEMRIELGRHAEALPLLEKARELGIAMTGPDGPDALVAETLIARIDVEQGRAAQGLAALERAAAGLRALEATTVNDYARTLQALAAAYLGIGRVRDAVRLWREMLDDITRRRGPSHPWATLHRVGLAEALLAAGERAEAAAVLAAITPEARARLPDSHPVHATARRLRELIGDRSVARGGPAS